jgi:anti-sigma regulatory factor (Ser/Thr protein kinase)
VAYTGEPTLSSQLHLIEDRSQVGSVRRAATQLAGALNFPEVESGKVALAATEIATNILKHAGYGRIVLRALDRSGVAGIELLGLDRGPGIANLTASRRDGESTAGSPGQGLGALARLSPTFEIYTQPRRGTALRIEFWARPAGAPAYETGVVCVAKPGESVSGDDWAAHFESQFATVLVTDGLGHGPEAARAARAATHVLLENPTAMTGRLLEECHVALAPTRGATVAAARIDAGAAQGMFAGVGNIVARVLCDGDQRNLVSHNGTVGHTVRRIQEFGFQFGPDAVLVMHSDGMDTRWNLASDYPGLANRHPGLIAGVLYRDHDRGRDDVTVFVLRTARGFRA